MAKDIAGFTRFAPRCRTNRYRKRIGGVVFGRGHRQADHQRGSVVERFWRQHQKGMTVPHFPSGMRTAVDP